MRITIALVISAALVAGLTTSALAHRVASTVSPETRICGQIKHGPYATGPFPLDQKIVKGTTWTVFSDGVPCGFALARTPALLKQWAKARSASDLKPGLAGWICKRDEKPAVIGSCIKGSKKEFDFWMTGKYTLAQLKAFKFLGH